MNQPRPLYICTEPRSCQGGTVSCDTKIKIRLIRDANVKSCENPFTGARDAVEYPTGAPCAEILV